METGNPKPLVNDRPLLTAALGFSLGIFFCHKLAGTWLLYAMCLFAVLLLLSLFFKRNPLYTFISALLLGICRQRLAFALPGITVQILLSPLLARLVVLKDLLLSCTDALFYDLSPLFRAMLWGETSLIARADISVFRTAGLSHILALSGLHVGFFAGALLLLIPKNHPRLRFWLVSSFLLLYCCIAAFPSSLIRASIMTVCMLGASLCRRPYDLPCSLALSAFIILLFSPEALFDVGFQLSFSAVAGIAMITPLVTQMLSNLPGSLSQSVSVATGATVGTLPLSLLHFKTFPVYSLVSNLFLLPLIPFSLISAFAAVLLGLFFPTLAKLPAFVAYHLMLLVKSLTGLIAALPYSSISFKQAPGGLFIILCYCGMFAVSPFVLRSSAWKLRALCLVLFLMLALSLCGILFV